ncbi:unnamed protein product [Clavelina lepadiformis]|uniref:Uncharacterized protein n=1 Tax=Clavelina lepadiformis TaxID=159417 RepID=A0ABP0GHJ0_CLALP
MVKRMVLRSLLPEITEGHRVRASTALTEQVNSWFESLNERMDGTTSACLSHCTQLSATTSITSSKQHKKLLSYFSSMKPSERLKPLTSPSALACEALSEIQLKDLEFPCISRQISTTGRDIIYASALD